MNQEFASLEIKVVTGAKHNEICEFLIDGSLKVKIHAKPVEGKANQELMEFLSHRLDISISDVVIVRGKHSKRKVLQFLGISQDELIKRLGKVNQT